MRIGWYVGTENHNWSLRMSGLVTTIAKKLGKSTSDVIVYGSSAGGFASLMLAARLRDATAIAINPQTDILKYSKRLVSEFLQTCFSNRNELSLLTRERGRMRAGPVMLQANGAKYVIVQNTLDRHHYEHHYKPFCQLLGVPVNGGKSHDGRGMSIIYTHTSGHGREPQELVASIVSAGIELAQISLNLEATTPATVTVKLKKVDKDMPRIRANQLYLLINRSQAQGSSTLSFSPPGRTDLDPYRLSLPLNWDIDPYKDRNWCAQLHMWRMIDNNLIEFDLTEDATKLELPVRFIDDWYRHHMKECRPSKFAWMDMMVGLRAMKLAFILSTYQAGLLKLTRMQLDAYAELVESHIAFLMNPAFVSYSNHTFIDMHGLAALRSVITGKKCIEIDCFLDDVIPKLLASQFNDDGVHLENSTGYQAFGIGCVKRLLNSGWFSRFQLDRLIRQASTVNNFFKMPDGRTVPIGDTDGAIMVSTTVPAFKASHELFNSSGYVIYRDDGQGQVARSSYLFFMGAFNSRFHKQSDDLSVTWFEGEDILCDAGKFAYKSSEIRGFVQSTRAHNTVEIDGQSSGEAFSGKPHLIYGSAVRKAELTDWGFSLTGDVCHEKSGVRHTRHLLYGRKNWLLIIDRVTSIDGEALHRFTQWLHFSPHLNGRVTGGTGYLATLDSGKSLNVLARGTGIITTSLVRGQLKPVRQGWISQGYGQLTPADALAFTQEGCTDSIFATLLTIGSSDARLEISTSKVISVVPNVESTHEREFQLCLVDNECFKI